jgi:hypothetical protein
MHGELMDFNTRLHKMLNYRTAQVEKLKAELVELRGPVIIIYIFKDILY